MGAALLAGTELSIDPIIADRRLSSHDHHLHY